MKKPFIFTHSAIFILALCVLINYISSTKHMCCDGGPDFTNIVWNLAWILFFTGILIIFDILTLIKNSKEKQNGNSKKKS